MYKSKKPPLASQESVNGGDSKIDDMLQYNPRINHENLQAYRAPIQASSSLGFQGTVSVFNKGILNPSIAFFRNHVPGGNTIN